MEPMIGEIRIFAGNFAPRGWAFCEGQLLSIAQNNALFSILGTTYGGDGRTSFGLPDMRGRTAIAPGTGPGLSTFRLGQKGGVAEQSLNSTQLANHSHQITANLKAAPGDGTTGVADNNSLAHQARGNTVPNIYNSNAPTINLHPNTTSLTLGAAGGSQPVNNLAPSLGIHYIVALVGIYPSRS